MSKIMAYIVRRNSKFPHYIHLILTPLFKEFTEEGEAYGHIIQGSIAAHTVYLQVTLLEEIFSEQLMTHRLFVASRSPYLKACHYYLCQILGDRMSLCE